MGLTVAHDGSLPKTPITRLGMRAALRITTMSNQTVSQIVVALASNAVNLAHGNTPKGRHVHQARKAVMSRFGLTEAELTEIECEQMIAFLAD